jgi:hypothetical protein
VSLFSLHPSPVLPPYRRRVIHLWRLRRAQQPVANQRQRPTGRVFRGPYIAALANDRGLQEKSALTRAEYMGG